MSSVTLIDPTSNTATIQRVAADLTEFAEAGWFAVQTRPKHEKKVTQRLTEKGVHSFLPLYRERKKWSDRQQWVELPLFSHYVFVRILESVEWRVRVLRTDGVVQFVGTAWRGTQIPPEQIENLQSIVKQGLRLMPHPFIKVGEKVRIRGGALDGVQGLVTAIRNDRSLVVSVDLIQKSVSMRIEGFEVERV